MTRLAYSLKTLLLATTFAGFAATAGFAQEQQPAVEDITGPEGETAAIKDENAVIAIVNGYEIRTSEVRMAFDDVIGQLPNLPKKLRYPFVVEFLVERHLLAQLANKEGISETDDYKRRLAAYQAKALRDSYLAQVISKDVTEDEVKVVYEERSKEAEGNRTCTRTSHPRGLRKGSPGGDRQAGQGRKVRSAGQAVQP